MSKMEKVKQHFRENEKFYVGIGVGVGLAVITGLIMRTHSGPSLRSSSIEDLANADTSVIIKSSCGRLIDQGRVADDLSTNTQMIMGSHFVAGRDNNITMNNVPVKRLSYIVSQDGTDKFWRSQAEAAQYLGISENRISEHLNRGEPLAGGISLTREGVSSAD